MGANGRMMSSSRVLENAGSVEEIEDDVVMAEPKSCRQKS